jgi:hypothetical protein
MKERKKQTNKQSKLLSSLKPLHYIAKQFLVFSPSFLLRNCALVMKFLISCTLSSTKIVMPLVRRDIMSQTWSLIYRWVAAFLSLYALNCCQAVHNDRFMHYINRLRSLPNYNLGGHMEKIIETSPNINSFAYLCLFFTLIITYHTTWRQQYNDQDNAFVLKFSVTNLICTSNISTIF